jgi:hypothetical protein
MDDRLAEQQQAFENEIRQRLTVIEQAVKQLAVPDRHKGQEQVLVILGKIACALSVPGFTSDGRYTPPPKW